jgi:hypothetical protein
MYETMTIDSKTMIIRTDNENEPSEVIDFEIISKLCIIYKKRSKELQI